MLSCGRGAGKNEDSGTDNGAHSERSERPRPERLFKTVLRFFGISNEFVDGLLCEELAGQNESPASDWKQNQSISMEVGRRRQVKT